VLPNASDIKEPVFIFIFEQVHHVCAFERILSPSLQRCSQLCLTVASIYWLVLAGLTLNSATLAKIRQPRTPGTREMVVAEVKFFLAFVP
jgi:hypothetical protein